MALKNFKGYLLAAIAAAAYGTNPAFALPLYEQGMNPNSVLLFRYLLGLPIIACILRIRNLSFRLQKEEILHVIILGVLMALSSLSLFESYKYMNSGIASTLLFVYPIMVAVLMIFLFHEKFKISVGLCLIIMSAGLFLLMKPQGDTSLSLTGILLVMVSAGTYAIYIILVNISKTVKTIPTTKLLFYVLLTGALFYVCLIPLGFSLTLPAKNSGWLSLLALAIIPTVISLACTTRAIQLIGSTPTAIFGALEPVSAVILSVTVLGQSITAVEIIGGVLIVIATTIVVADNSVDKIILHVRKMFPRPHKRNHNSRI
ncbi:MAG: EamA family transporter [Bacteroides sp.]|nr:EamA family transporter [Bacteroides sp.]MBD5357267.1 EamA family transporter [Bacteroides sp.]